MTGYTVFRRTRDSVKGDNPVSELWEIVAVVKANSSEAAIRWYVKSTNEAGVYTATPTRSWKPTAVQVETTTTINFGVPVAAPTLLPVDAA